MNRRGQALVEFVLILPVFLFLIMAVVDFGIIFNRKNALETASSDIVHLYQSEKTIEEIRGLYPKYTINIAIDNEYDVLTIASEVKLNTPGFNRIFGNPYQVKVERYLYHEQ